MEGSNLLLERRQMEGSNLRLEVQQELVSSTAIHTVVGFLIVLLLTLLQVKYQNSGNPFQMHGATMLFFIIAVVVYAIIALVGIHQWTPNTSYIQILRRVCFIFGAFACGLLLLLLVPPLGWLILILCVCMFVQLLCDSHEQILEYFQQFFQSINQSTSQGFNILCGWSQDCIQTLCQAGSKAFKRSPMPTTNSTEQPGLEMAVTVAE